MSPRGTRRSSGLTAWLAEDLGEPGIACQIREATFVIGKLPGVHQDDGAGVDAVRSGLAKHRAGLGFVKRLDFVTIDADAPLDLLDPLIQHRRQGYGEVEQAGTSLVADAEGVGETAVDQQQRAVALTLQQCVRGDGGAHLHRLDQIRRDGGRPDRGPGPGST